MSEENTKHIQTPLEQVLLKCKIMFKYALLFGCLVNILMLATPIYSMQVLDRVISSANTDTLVMLTIVIVASIAMLSLIQVARAFAINRMGSWFEQELSSKLFANAIRASVLGRVNSGSQQLRDLQSIKTFLTSPSLISILDIPWALIFVIVLFMIHSYMGILTVLGGIILVFMAIASDKLTKPLHDSSNENFLVSMRQVDQATRNAEVVTVMGLLPQIHQSWQDVNKKVQEDQNIVGMRQQLLSEITKFIRMLLQILVTGLGAYLVLRNEMSTGAIIACSSLSSRALSPFEQAITSWKGFLTTQQSYKRLTKILEKFYTEEKKMKLPEPLGRIKVTDLSYTIPGMLHPIISKIQFSLEPGEVLSIVGPSGSGKTTLAKLVVGAIKPTSGSVRIDNASLEDWDRTQLGQYIGYLPQGVELFNGSIKHNIGRMNQDPDPDEVVHAAKLAGVHDMILKLPKGYDTDIGIDGSSLSGGQRQRIGLARAFFGTPKVLVLDEPNANLDTIGEEALAEAIRAAKASEITTILISHRTNILSLSDKIMVVQNGTISMYGPALEILDKLNKKEESTKNEQQPFRSRRSKLKGVENETNN